MPQFFVDAATPAGQRAIALRFAIDFTRPGFRANAAGFGLDTQTDTEPVLRVARAFLPFLAGDTVAGAVNLAATSEDLTMNAQTIRANLYVLSKSEVRHSSDSNTVGYTGDVCEVTLGIDNNNPEQLANAESNRALFGAPAPERPITLTLPTAIADSFELGQCVPIGLMPGGDPASTWSWQQQTAGQEQNKVTA